MKAPKISHTIVLAKPDSAQVSAALYALKPGLASSAGANSTNCERTVTTVTPISPIAPPGSGSSIRPRMTPAKIAKKYHAWGARPAGGGISASTIARTIGASAFHETCGGRTVTAGRGASIGGTWSWVTEIAMRSLPAVNAGGEAAAMTAAHVSGG